jgi:hypothetical protein
VVLDQRSSLSVVLLRSREGCSAFGFCRWRLARRFCGSCEKAISISSCGKLVVRVAELQRHSADEEDRSGRGKGEMSRGKERTLVSIQFPLPHLLLSSLRASFPSVADECTDVAGKLPREVVNCWSRKRPIVVNSFREDCERQWLSCLPSHSRDEEKERSPSRLNSLTPFLEKRGKGAEIATGEIPFPSNPSSFIVTTLAGFSYDRCIDGLNLLGREEVFKVRTRWEDEVDGTGTEEEKLRRARRRRRGIERLL